MTMKIVVPEELQDMIKEIVAYEEMSEEDAEWAQEWLYIDPPEYSPPSINNIDEEDTWKIEIQI